MSDEVPVFLHAKKVKDIPFCLLFIVMIIAQGLVCYVGAKDGNLSYLVKPSDYKDNICGVDNTANKGLNLESKPYLYFISPMEVAKGNSKSVCVDKCPLTTTTNYNEAICIEGVKPTDVFQWNTQVQAGNCTSTVYDSKIVFNRCIPKSVQAVAKTGFNKNSLLNSGTSNTQVIFADVITAYPHILIALAFSVVVAFFYLVLMNYITAIITWVSVVLGQLILIAMAVYSYFEYDERQLAMKTDTSEQIQWESNIALVALIVMATLSLGYFFILLILRKRITIAVEIIKESSSALRTMKSLFAFPILTGLLQLIVIGYFFVVAALLLSVDRVPGTKTLDKNIYQYLQWFNLFGMLWGVSFIYGFHQTVIAGSVASWYWSLNKKNAAKNPLLNSLKNAICYSLGSIALGSLILAIVRFIRFVLMYLQRGAKQQKNKVLARVFACLQCCFACIEKIVKFMNKNTYVVVGIYGTSFCKSARTAFGLLTRNALRLVAINAVSGFVVFIGKMFVSLLTTGIAYYFLRYLDKTGQLDLTFPMIPAAIILIISFILAGVFFDVVDMAIGTLY